MKEEQKLYFNKTMLIQTTSALAPCRSNTRTKCEADWLNSCTGWLWHSQRHMQILLLNRRPLPPDRTFSFSVFHCPQCGNTVKDHVWHYVIILQRALQSYISERNGGNISLVWHYTHFSSSPTWKPVNCNLSSYNEASLAVNQCWLKHTDSELWDLSQACTHSQRRKWR